MAASAAMKEVGSASSRLRWCWWGVRAGRAVSRHDGHSVSAVCVDIRVLCVNSAFNALTLTPALSAIFSQASRARQRDFCFAVQQGSRRATNAYRSSIGFVLQWRVMAYRILATLGVTTDLCLGTQRLSEDDQAT